jgi:hypothetical protein
MDTALVGSMLNPLQVVAVPLIQHLHLLRWVEPNVEDNLIHHHDYYHDHHGYRSDRRRNL